MNKQELIEKYKTKGEVCKEFPVAAISDILKDLRELDEPQKVTVPQFVADWYEEHKDNLEFNIFDYVYRFDQNAVLDFKDWFDDFNTKPIQTLVNMHQFGYEVEEEKRYLVKLKGIEKEKCYLNYNFGRVWLFYNQENFYGYRAHHTRKELEEAGFGEVFNSPLFEVEEVTE